MKKKYIRPQATVITMDSSMLLAGSGGQETGTAGNKGETTYNGNDGTIRLAKGNNLFEDSEEDDDPWSNNLW